MKKIEFKTAKEMINWLMDNQGTELADGYGRRWKYEKFNFYFKDIGTNEKYEEGISCLHLYGTSIGIVSANPSKYPEIMTNLDYNPGLGDSSFKGIKDNG